MDIVYFDKSSDAWQHEDAEIRRLQPKHNVTQRDVKPESLPSIHNLTDAQVHDFMDLWSSEGKRAAVVRKIGEEVVGAVVTDAWCQRVAKKYNGTAARKPERAGKRYGR